MTRVLPASEWDRVAGLPVAELLPWCDPAQTSVIVVEEDGRLLATWAATTFVHLEGLWIAPEARGRVSVARRLWREAMRVLRGLGRSVAWTGDGGEAAIRRLLLTAKAVPLPGTWYVLPGRER